MILPITYSDQLHASSVACIGKYNLQTLLFALRMPWRRLPQQRPFQESGILLSDSAFDLIPSHHVVGYIGHHFFFRLKFSSQMLVTNFDEFF